MQLHKRAHRRVAVRRRRAILQPVTAMMALCCSVGRVDKTTAFSPVVTPPATRRSTSSYCGRPYVSVPRGCDRDRVSSLKSKGEEHGGWGRSFFVSLTFTRRQGGGAGGVWAGRRGTGSSLGMTSSSEDEEEAARAEEFESIFDKNSAILDVPLETFDESNVEPLMPGSVRTELPVFMLDVSACPGGVVPLHIFEMRYRQMFNDIGTKDNRFGMLVTDPKTKKPCKYGAVMECAQRKLLPDGRQYVLNQAVERFRVLKVLKTTPYTVMEAEVGIPDNKPFEGEPSKWGAPEGTKLEDLELEVYSTVNSVVKLMNKLAPPATPGENRTLSEWFLRYSPKVRRDEGLEGESAGDDLAEQAKEDERRMNFSFAVAEMIAMESHTKQLLLQSRSTAYRLAAVREILVKAQKELAAKSSLKDTLG